MQAKSEVKKAHNKLRLYGEEHPNLVNTLAVIGVAAVIGGIVYIFNRHVPPRDAFIALKEPLRWVKLVALCSWPAMM
jgi:hypothetical protein